MQRFPLSALLVEQDSCCLVLPLAEEAFVKSAKGLNQKLEGVVTTGAPHLGHIPYPLLKFCFLCPPCSCLHEYVTSHKVFHCCHFPKLFSFLESYNFSILLILCPSLGVPPSHAGFVVLCFLSAPARLLLVWVSCFLTCLIPSTITGVEHSHSILGHC